MLEILEIPDSTRNIIAPSVYIDSIVLENGQQTVHYSLIDENNEWMTNNQILDNLFVYITDGIQTDKRLLKTTVTANTIRNNTVSDYAIFANTGSNITVKAWVANEYISGTMVSESILNNGTVSRSSFGNLELQYINKIKNLNILNFDIKFETSSFTDSTPLDSDLLISYRLEKNANLAFIFNLEKFLEQNSKNYNILKKNKTYRQLILANSSIDTTKSYFAKRNLSKKEKNSVKIANQLEANLISSTSGSYYVSVADDNADISNCNYYDVDVHLEINDFSTNFLSDSVNQKLIFFINTIKAYKNKFELTVQNKSIEDVNSYIFENYYEELINNKSIEEIVNTLSPICSLFSGREQAEFASLFVSLLHPLTTSIALLERFILFLNNFQNTISSLLIKVIAADSTAKELKQTNLTFDKKFGKNDENPYLADFNYDYDYLYGIEVVKSDTINNLASAPLEPTNVITLNELISRKTLEARKYFQNPSANTINGAKYLSIANLFFNNSEYNLLINLPTNNTTIFNEAYIKTKDYNTFNFGYNSANTYVFELLNNGINIKTLSNRSNNSTNNLLKSTLFDSNRDTATKSAKFIADTNIKNLYFGLDKTTFVDFGIQDTGSLQYKGINTGSTTEIPVYAFKEESLTNPDLKAKSIIYYNSIYKLDLLQTGDLLDIYELKEAVVNAIFTKKLRLMTQNFAVRKAFSFNPTPSLQIFNIQTDATFNIKPIYLNRNVVTGSINITTEDI